MGTYSPIDASDSNVYLHVENYHWDADEEFQAGLTAILGPTPQAEQRESLTLQARCFFYSRQATPS